MIKQSIDGIPFLLRENRDFSFLSRYGQVFCVFDQNDSGNISFGLDDSKKRRFIKIAGAKTAHFEGDPRQARAFLQSAMPLYEALRHPLLIELLEHYAQDDLYVAVFGWAEGECLFDHWNFDKYERDPALQSPRSRFDQLPLQKRLAAADVLFQLLIQMEEKGYVAVDFYDGSLLYDFARDRVTICDVDFFRKMPAHNDIGENFWGTKRLKAPEEYLLGASIDERTDVHTLGALLMHFFGSYSKEELDAIYGESRYLPCQPASWQLDRGLYDIALRAVNDDPKRRFPNVAAFYAAWKVMA